MEDKDANHPFAKLMQNSPNLRDFALLLPLMNTESDRGMVLIACSFVDELLHQILKGFFVEERSSALLLEGERAPLGSLTARTQAAYALGLIYSREKAEVDALRRIRNRFAHSVHVSFDDAKILEICKCMTMGIPGAKKGRVILSSATASLILELTNRAVYVSRERRTRKVWPH